MLQTYDRQTTDERQTDGRAIAYSERERIAVVIIPSILMSQSGKQFQFNCHARNKDNEVSWLRGFLAAGQNSADPDIRRWLLARNT